MADVTVDLLDPADDNVEAAIADSEEVLRRSYGFAREGRVRRYLAVAPSAWAVARNESGCIVGVGGCVAYPDAGFGWIGLIGTDPAHGRRGTARRVTQTLIDELARHGCRAALDASDAGAPLYESMGFTDHGLSMTLTFDVPTVETPGARPLHINDFERLSNLYTYDRDRFGADRSRLLHHLLAQPGTSAFSVGESTITGFAFTNGGLVGPIVADDSKSLSALMYRATSVPGQAPHYVFVPHDSIHLPTLLSLGAKAGRTLRHQRLALRSLPGQRHFIAGQLSLGEG
jgi:GNAT superfamily N-acetyltransferase